MDYPVVFKCYACTVEHANLAQFEAHIWSRHLQTFQFYCAACGFPSVSEKALEAHYYDHHPNSPIEFKRKIEVENELRQFITHSIVVPLYDEQAETEVLYEEDTVQEGLEDMETLQPADQEHFHMVPGPSGLNEGRRGSGQGKEEADQWDEQPPELKRIEDDQDLIYMNRMDRNMPGQHGQDDMHGGVEVIAEEEVEDEMELAETVEMDEDGLMESVMEGHGDHHYHPDHLQQDFLYDEDGEVFEEGEDVVDGGGEMQYMDEQGNIFVPSDFVSKSVEGRPIHHMRMLKNRHMDWTVRTVAESHRHMRKKPVTEEMCDICGKYIKYPSRILAHQRMHAMEKIFACPHCNKSFSQRASLNVHMRKHTGERPFQCMWDNCDRSFPSSSALKMHEKKHSGERKYHCAECGLLFTTKAHADRHRKTKHGGLLMQEVMEPPEEPTEEDKALVNGVVESVRLEKRIKMMRMSRVPMEREREEEDESLHE